MGVKQERDQQLELVLRCKRLVFDLIPARVATPAADQIQGQSTASGTGNFQANGLG
jgi:hypothetical protein